MHLAELLILKSKPFWNNSIMIPKQVALFDKQHYLRFSEIVLLLFRLSFMGSICQISINRGSQSKATGHC